MEPDTQINRFREFLDLHYNDVLLDKASKGEEYIVIPFPQLAIFDPRLAEELLENPEDVIKAAEYAISKFDLGVDIEIKARFSELPFSSNIVIRNIRSKHIDKFIEFKGIVRQKTDVRPQVTSAKFECPSCGAILTVLQMDTKFKEPSSCSCGRKGKFNQLAKELVDAQKLVIEEAPEDLDGGEQPKRINVFLKNDLVSPISDRKTNPGSKIVVTGVLKEVPITLASGGKSTRFDLMIEANYVAPIQEEFATLEISEEEKQKITEMSKDKDIYNNIITSMAPTIYGHDRIKEALTLQLFGGTRKSQSDGVMRRGDIHILLIGDPGSGKSQLLKRMSHVAPKSRFVSGKGASGAGLTASVVKDEFLRGWALEAGALVLANRGLVCIDELDKMTKEDASAMHEALEQQCYDYDTIITLADGSEVKIGDFVEQKFEKHPDKIIQGKDCLILEPDVVQEKVFSTDWDKIAPVKIDRVSKHISTKKMIQISVTNGRKIKVTPEHPVFIIEKGEIETKRADQIKKEDFIPIPAKIPVKGEKQYFKSNYFNERAINHIKVPVSNCKELYKIAGYLISEGSSEINRGKKIGVNFTNKSEILLEDFKDCMKKVFDITPYEQERKDHNEPRLMLRYISTELATFFEKELKSITELSGKKEVPQKLMKGKLEDVAAMLQALFEGDGHVSKKPRTLRIGYATNSPRLAQQVQDLLLRFEIRSSITEHKKSYKVNITGYENILRFNEKIGFMSEERALKVKEYLKNKTPIRTIKDVVPNCGEKIIALLQKANINKVNNNTFATMKHDYLKKKKAISRKQLQKLLEETKKRGVTDKTLEKLAYGDIRFEKVKEVKEVNSTHEWTYDITVEPNHTFISQGAILHNTITISKANIQATLRSETTVLAAANPKFGRFDPYEVLAKQIDLPSTLINRFDLIFPVKDLPDLDKDEKLASFILKLHKGTDIKEVMYDTDEIKRYVGYAKQKVVPKLTDDALLEIKKYFVEMRNSGSTEEKIQSIPISARQLEGLVRLSEASARTRLSEKVTKKDAQRAIDLLHHCLMLIGYDSETGKFDIDRITTGITASQRSHISIVKDLISELEAEHGKMIPVDDLLQKAEERGVSEEKVNEVLEKLKRAGDIFNPRHGFISKI